MNVNYIIQVHNEDPVGELRISWQTGGTSTAWMHCWRLSSFRRAKPLQQRSSPIRPG
jgi:hypothetical protein